MAQVASIGSSMVSSIGARRQAPGIYRAPERRWYELLDLNLAAGHALTAQVNNRGAELLLQNSGPAATFELRVHYGMDRSQVAVRSGVALDANRAFHIAPQDWNAESISDTPVHMTVFDAKSGTVVKQTKL
jgi:hypothetical protein